MSRLRMEKHFGKTQSVCDIEPVRRGAGGGDAALAGRRYHFIGAGGVGMSGLARLVIKNGAAVAGSDLEKSHVVSELSAMGADIRIGHSADNLSLPIDTVVISAAIKEDNPELCAARAAGCEVYKYAQMLGELMDRYQGIAVCGTHGKSTTGAWLAYVLDRTGQEPNFIVGADIPQLGGNSGVGRVGGHFVAEACEYDRSFMNLRPRICVMLNVEQDHLDYYADEEEIVGAFGDFAMNVRPGGVLVANGADANVAKVIARCGDDVDVVTFGLDEKNDYHAKNKELVDGLYRFDVYHAQKLLGRTAISLPGEHNICNALAVIAVAAVAGIEIEHVLKVLDGFNGIDRRLMLKGVYGGVTVMDDYAHHPTEIRASLSALRQRYEPERLWCVFQPHQYSRTRFLLDDFADSFALADITIVPEIYFVRDTLESKRQVNAEVLVERIKGRNSQALFVPEFGAICNYLKEHVRRGDLVVTMGAGPVWRVADEYIQWLGKNS